MAAAPATTESAAAPTRQLLFAAAWGVLDLAGGRVPLAQLPQLLDKLKALGYDGIEIPVAFAMQFGSTEFDALLLSKRMLCVLQIFSSGAHPTGGPPTPGNLRIASQHGIVHEADPADGHDVAAHVRIWTAQAEECLKLQSSLHAVTSHTGKDFYSAEEADAHFDACIAFEQKHGLIVNHETHRARILYSPWVVARVLARHPQLRLCADLSHYTCVTEASPLEPELNKVIALLAPRVRHVHARVGFEEGPQVLDPRVAPWAPYMEGFKTWWCLIYEQSRSRGDALFSTTPEFGPAAYAWVGLKGETIANVWSVNHWVGSQMALLHKSVHGGGVCALADDPDEGAWTL